jgi:hypothetical protein
MQLGAKPIYHLEAFVANTMLAIKQAREAVVDDCDFDD